MAKAKKQVVKSLNKTITKKIRLKYLLYLPKEYEESRKKWPLVLFLHGAGERGSDIERVKVHGLPKMVEHDDDFPFIIVSPQCPKDQGWEGEPLKTLIDEIVENYRVDKARIYATGISMGGYGTWSLACDYPDLFAAIVPICGGGRRLHARLLKDTPVWAFHGRKDDIVPFIQSKEMVDAVKAAGGDAKLTAYPKANHDSWTRTYDNPALYKWLLSHKRSRGSSHR